MSWLRPGPAETRRAPDTSPVTEGLDAEYGRITGRGTTAYRALHRWVAKGRGKPQRCEECGKDGPGLYHWSNISGEYHWELADFRRLCPACHARCDAAQRRARA